MLPVLIGLGIAYLASEAVSKNNDKKKRQAMQANHVSKVKQLENRINKLKTELKKYGAEIETAKAITEKNLKKLDDMLLALKRVEKNLGDTSFTGASSASASLLVFGNSLQRAIERKKLQEKYDQQVAVLETAIRRLEVQVETARKKSVLAQREADLSNENNKKFEDALRNKQTAKQ
jgi:outer membrane murein-binding lipoprotein Lpp